MPAAVLVCSNDMCTPQCQIVLLPHAVWFAVQGTLYEDLHNLSVVMLQHVGRCSSGKQWWHASRVARSAHLCDIQLVHVLVSHVHHPRGPRGHGLSPCLPSPGPPECCN